MDYIPLNIENALDLLETKSGEAFDRHDEDEFFMCMPVDPSRYHAMSNYITGVGPHNDLWVNIFYCTDVEPWNNNDPIPQGNDVDPEDDPEGDVVAIPQNQHIIVHLPGGIPVIVHGGFDLVVPAGMPLVLNGNNVIPPALAPPPIPDDPVGEMEEEPVIEYDAEILADGLVPMHGPGSHGPLQDSEDHGYQFLVEGLEDVEQPGYYVEMTIADPEGDGETGTILVGLSRHEIEEFLMSIMTPENAEEVTELCSRYSYTISIPP